MAITTYKVCSRCELSKPLNEFYNNASLLRYGARDGKQPYCKECDNAKRMARYEEHRESELVRAAGTRARVGQEYYTEKMAEWRSRNRDHINAYQRAYRASRKASNVSPDATGQA